MPSNFGYIGDNQSLGAVGGLASKFTGTVALLVGDAVFASADNAVSKSTVAGDRLKRVGIVVGGDNYGDREAVASDDIGDAAAGAAGEVLVCYSGIAWGINGAGTITAGEQVMFSAATAGRLITATPATDAGKILGVALTTTAVAGAAVKILVHPC